MKSERVFTNCDIATALCRVILEEMSALGVTDEADVEDFVKVVRGAAAARGFPALTWAMVMIAELGDDFAKECKRKHHQ